MSHDTKRILLATNEGPLHLTLFPDSMALSPVQHFLQLAATDYFDGSICHSILPHFFLEFLPSKHTSHTLPSMDGLPAISFDRMGLVAIGPKNQLFISLDRCDAIENKYAVIGEIDSVDLGTLQTLAHYETDTNHTPRSSAQIICTKLLHNRSSNSSSTSCPSSPDHNTKKRKFPFKEPPSPPHPSMPSPTAIPSQAALHRQLTLVHAPPPTLHPIGHSFQQFQPPSPYSASPSSPRSATSSPTPMMAPAPVPPHSPTSSGSFSTLYSSSKRQKLNAAAGPGGEETRGAFLSTSGGSVGSLSGQLSLSNSSSGPLTSSLGGVDYQLARQASLVADAQQALKVSPLHAAASLPGGRAFSTPDLRSLAGIMPKWPVRVVVVRHGESEQNAALDLQQAIDNIDKIAAIRDADVKLTTRGLYQAKYTGLHLAKTERFDICFTSPYLRARQTAEEIVKQLPYQVKVFVDNLLREKEFGRLHGLQATHVKERFPGGENYPDVEMRVQTFLDRLARDYAGRSVLIVTHQVPFKMFRASFQHLDDEAVLGLENVSNCGVQEYLLDRRKSAEGRMKLKTFNFVPYDSEQIDRDTKDQYPQPATGHGGNTPPTPGQGPSPSASPLHPSASPPRFAVPHSPV